MKQEQERKKYEYDDNDGSRQHGEMPTMRTRVDEADARPAESLPKLQTAKVGSAEQMGESGYVYFLETEDRQFIKIGLENQGK